MAVVADDVVDVGVNMNCGCRSTCQEDVECEQVCSALIVSNSWNIPSCGNAAVLLVPDLAVALVGSYIWNPTYGFFRISMFDSINHQLTVVNECTDGNADAGDVVPADTTFIFGAPPGSTSVTYSQTGSGSGYTFTNSISPIVFGTTSPIITLTIPGTYELDGYFVVATDSLTNVAALTINGGLYRSNNTPSSLLALSALGIYPLTAVSMTIGIVNIPRLIYTTANSNDILTLQGGYSGTIGSGSVITAAAGITAVKLS